MAPTAAASTIEPSQPRANSRSSATSTRRIRWSGWLLLLVVLLIACMELSRHRVEANNIHRRFYRRSVRLCSRSLSDALCLLCKDRGYNEPFSSSGESEARLTTGPGLVEECCYNSCSIDQMEQYCKPKNKQAQA